MKTLTTCVIPAAGRGTRLLPLTESTPKEMLEVGGRPMIDWTVEEALDSGFSTICLIGSPRKRELESRVRRRLSGLKGIDFVYFEQDPPRGLARAIALADELIRGQPFALMLPDNLVRAAVPVIRQLLPVYLEYGLSVNALMEFSAPEPAAGFSDSGRMEIEPLGDRVYRVRAVHPKGRGPFPWKEGSRNIRLFPRQIIGPDFFPILDEMAPSADEEYDDVPIFRRLAEMGRLLACRVDAEVFDLGNPAGLQAARRRLKQIL